MFIKCMLRLVILCILAFVLANQFQSLCRFEVWALGDNGGHLTLGRLLDEGLRPNVDFAYSYGPGSVLIIRGWERLFGHDWRAFLALQLLLRATVLLLLVACLWHLDIPRPCAIVAVAVLPFFFPFEFSIAHAGEKAGLALAGIAVLRRAPGVAVLGCALAAAFRPACGLLLTAALVGWYAGALWRSPSPVRSWRTAVVRLVLPAAGAQFLIAALYIPLFGTESFAQTVLPISGMRMYESQNARGPIADLPNQFPAGQNLKGYLITNPAHVRPVLLLAIVLAAVVCAVRTTAVLYRRDREREPEPLQLLIAFLGTTLGVAFLGSYGGGVFYLYYFPLIWLALPALLAVARPRAPRAALVAFVVLAAAPLANVAQTAWQTGVSLAAAVLDGPHLELSSEREAEVRAVRELLAGREVAALPIMGEVQMLDAHGIVTDPNPYWCFRNRFNLPAERDRVRDRVLQRQLVLSRADNLLTVLRAADVTEYRVLYRGAWLVLVECD